jgi:starch synthase
MDKKRLLIVTQEMEPYTALSEIAGIVYQMPKYMFDQGMEIRLLMPRYGTINERRHRLHEVVRLSGMNIIVDDDDYPLIIKVASMPNSRLQVYFLDNEDFFKRKSVYEDADGLPFDDNPDRMIFFSKGIIETVKKFGWPPDIIHIHGWMTSLIPFYLKTAYKNEPLFANSKVVYSVYGEPVFDKDGPTRFFEKANINGLDASELEVFRDGDGVNMNRGACQYSDAIIIGSETLDLSVDYLSDAQEKPVLPFMDSNSDYLPTYLDFYQSLMTEEVVA